MQIKTMPIYGNKTLPSLITKLTSNSGGPSSASSGDWSSPILLQRERERKKAQWTIQESFQNKKKDFSDR